MITLTLTEAEQRLAQYLGKARFQACLGKVNEYQQGGQDAERINVVGAAGEILVARYLNVYPDMTLHLRSGGWDCEYEGTRIDVKTTSRKYPKPLLVVPPHKKRTWTDCFILCNGNYPAYDLVGYAMTEDIMEMEQKDLGHGPCWVLEQLQPMEQFCQAAFSRYEE